MQQAHRAGTLKQSNKAHKSKHRSKRGIAAAVKGKVNVKEFVRRNRRELKKDERRHQALQIRKNKREEALSKKRALGGGRNPPFLVCVVPLNAQLDVNSALAILKTCSQEAIITQTNSILHIGLPNFKQRFSFICPEVDDDFGLLDTLKVADTVLYVCSALEEPVDEWGEKVLALSMAQGMPTPVVIAMDMEGVHPKKRTAEKQSVQKLISKWLPEEKIMQLDKTSDGLNVFRRIGNQKRNILHHREKRPYMLAEDVEYVADNEGDSGTLKVTGYLRGMPLNVNGLVHISGLGDFQMSRIDGLDDPHPLNLGKENVKSNGMDAEVMKVSVLQVADPAKQESLQSENIPDPMDAEQTWPTEDDIEQANSETRKKKLKKVPKGWSDYQAAWIVESDAEGEESGDDSGSDDDDENEAFMSCEENSSDNEDKEEENDFESVAESEMGPTDEKYDATIDAAEEHEMLKKLAEAREDQQFPDEVDTPQDIPASERFMRYRGLESFRTSPWDPKENLPADYARIFQFENYDRTRRRVFKENEDSLLNTYGFYATIHVKGVRQDLWKAFHSSNGSSPLAVFGLLPHEHKMSVMNVVLKRTGASEEPIKSKERLIFQVGYRRFIVNPVFSQHTNGSKHKYERFFQPASTCVASFFAPIQFSPSTVLCFKEKKNTKLQLVASGVVLSCNPDRLVIKRIVLSGHPYKVNKRSAVIRFMFFNRADVVYFKPCKLRTKYGRTGHIKEPLGTHGHMKCVFDGQLKSQDTVLLNLYKRMYPKWTYEDCIVTNRNADQDAMEG